jgi:hypothetical protein
MNDRTPKSASISLKKLILTSVLLSGGFIYSAHAQPGLDIQVYKNPSCGCCGNWVKHLEANGFNATVTPTQNRQPLQTKMGVPRDKGACHTAVINGYFIEGHVPADDIKRLLTEKPNIAGLTVPGMPLGSPGMENPKYPAMAFPVLAIDKKGSSSQFNFYGEK